MDDKLMNVVQYHKKEIGRDIHSQMMEHARRWILPGSATPAATPRVRSSSRSRETWREPDGIHTWRRKPSATLLRKEQGGPPGTVWVTEADADASTGSIAAETA